MKKVFVVLFACAAFSFAACKSGGNMENKMDSTEVTNTVNDVMDSMQTKADAAMDTAKSAVQGAVDSMKNM